MGVLTGCKPRQEVLKGELRDAIFAADFGDLIAEKAPLVYGDAATFFRNTHPARELKRVIRAVFERLSDPSDGGATLRLSTGFGGGKTHTEMALWHLAHNVANLSLGTELLPAAGRPSRVHAVAIDAAKAGVPIFASHPDTEVRSLWGEVFYRLGGPAALARLGAADDPDASPNEGQLQAILPDGPLLFLLDELVIYMARLSERGQGNVLGFLNSLASVASKRPQTVVVVTDPATQAAYAREAAQLASQLENAARRLDEVFGRRMTDFDPIGDETAAVITRRLLEHVDRAAAEKASATYYQLYQRVLADDPTLLPRGAGAREYAERILQSYPFHPRLLETAQNRLGSLQDFQRSRGVLRLFARLLRDVWVRGEDLELITAGEVNWHNPEIQGELLQRLNRESFKAAAKADVEGHAGELDGGAARGVHQRIASALLLESLTLQPSAGLDRPEITLATLRPEEAGPEPSEALDRLAGVCWHTYPLAGGRGWQFRYEPNVIKQIEERKALIPLEDARSWVATAVQGYFSGYTFKLASWPSTPAAVGRTASLQLALCDDEALAKRVCQYEDDRDPSAPMPRSFQNAVLGVAPSAGPFGDALDRARRFLAAELIQKESRGSSTARLVQEQLQRLLPEYQKQAKLQAIRAFNRVVLASGVSLPLEEKYQVGDEQALANPHGQRGLLCFLQDKRLVYGSDDALDLDLFVNHILPGATPDPNESEAWSAKAVHERFLSAPNLRLLLDSAVVWRTLEKALREAKIVLRLADGRALDATGCVQGPPGQRRRGVLAGLPSFQLDDTTLVAFAGGATASRWLQMNEEVEAPLGQGWGGGGGWAPPPPPSGPVGPPVASTWDDAVKLAGEHPLVSLELTASSPAEAAGLIGLAQPLGAESLELSVTVSGVARDGGSISFSAQGVKHNHPTRPLQVAQTIHTALLDGASYEAILKLKFGLASREGLAEALAETAEKAGAVRPLARFVALEVVA